MGVMEARRRILLNQPHLVDASGNPISFSTDMAAKMGVKAYFSPVQSGSGDPSPSNVRPISGWTGVTVFHPTGVNRWDEQWEVGQYNTSGIPSSGSNQIRSKNLIPVEPETEYYLYTGVKLNLRIYFCAENGSIISYQSSGKGTFTTPANCRLIKFHTGSGYGETYNNNISINYPATETEYHAFATTYPVTFPAVGKNLLNPALKKSPGNSVCLVGIENDKADGSIVLEAGTYTLSRVLTDGRSWREGRAVDSQGNILARRYSDRNYISFTLQTKQAVGIYVSVFLDDYPAIQSELQLESGSTATSYEPFTNTLYGGYVDYERGEVVAEYQYISLKDLNPITYGSPSYDGTLGTNVMYYIPKASRTVGSYSNKAKGTSAGTWDDPNANIWKYTINSNTQLHVVCDNDTVGITQDMTFSQKRSTFKQWLQDNNMIFVLPITNNPDKVIYHLTPTIIKSLKGANTIWSDTNGNVSLKYWKH